MTTYALIVAAGTSERLSAELPKQYTAVNGKTILRHSVEAFLYHPRIDGVRVVIRREHHPLYRKTMNDLTLFPIVVGGATRQDSVRRGLEALADRKPDYVLIHDAARPLVDAALIDRVLNGLKESEAVLPALAVADTIKRVAGGKQETVNRAELVAAQTPQGFRFNTILDLHRRFRGENFTDDVALAEAAGIPVKIVEGSTRNFKVTTREDMERLKREQS